MCTTFNPLQMFDSKNLESLGMPKKLVKMINDCDSVFFASREFLESAQFRKFQESIISRIGEMLKPYSGSFGKIFNSDRPECIYRMFIDNSITIASAHIFAECENLAAKIDGDPMYSSLIKQGPGREHFHKAIASFTEKAPDITEKRLGFGGGMFLYGSRMTTGPRVGKRDSDAYDVTLSPYSWTIMNKIKRDVMSLVETKEYRAADSQEQGEKLSQTALTPINLSLFLLRSILSVPRAKMIQAVDGQEKFEEAIKNILGLDEYSSQAIMEYPKEGLDALQIAFLQVAESIELSYSCIREQERNPGIMTYADIPDWAVKEATAELCIDLIRDEYLKGNGITNMSNFAQKAAPPDSALPSLTMTYLKILCEKLFGLLGSVLTDEHYAQIDKVNHMYAKQQELIDEMREKDWERIEKEKEDQALEPAPVDYAGRAAAYEKKISELQRLLKEKDHDISARDAEVKSLEAQLGQMAEQYRDLSDELDQANELIASSEEDAESGIETPEAGMLLHRVAGKRLLFVRRHDASGYKVMLDIKKYLPSAKFTPQISSMDEVRPYDAVIFMTRFMHHRDYWLSKSLVKSAEGVTMVHCSSSAIKGVLQAIVDADSQNGTSAFVAGKM